ncbi:hypothetical protein AB0J42_25515 [Nonomuraea sp. NPDC049649]|uniref:hypothetical protein n=1 Tax=Nonomuraea sp. NPDC049649 TaxID=3155776 RepID=UPI00341DCA98
MGFPEEPQTGADGTPRRSRRDRQPPTGSGFFTPAQQNTDGQPPTGSFPQAGSAFTPRQQGDAFSPRGGRPGSSDPFASGPPTGPLGADPFTSGPAGSPDPFASGPPTGPLGSPDPFASGPTGSPDPFGSSPTGSRDPLSSGPPTGPMGAASGPPGGSDPFASRPSDAFTPGSRKPPPGAPQPPTEAFTQPPAGDTPPPADDAAQEPKDGGRGRRGRSKAAKPDKPGKSEEKPEKDEKAKTPRQTWSPYDEGPRSRGPLWASLAGLGVLVLLGGGLAVMFNTKSPETVSSAELRTSAPLPSAPPGKFGYAGSRSTDPDPLTVKELFRSKKITVSGRAYQMTVTSKDKKCADGVHGDKLGKALKSGKCTQMMRASFRDKKGEVIGTVGVANLSTTKNATRVAKAADKTNYVKPLAGKDEVTKFLGSGSGGAKVWTHGHYAVMVWFQLKDGSEPDKKVSKRLFQAADDITKSTVFKALDARSLTGSRAA